MFMKCEMQGPTSTVPIMFLFVVRHFVKQFFSCFGTEQSIP